MEFLAREYLDSQPRRNELTPNLGLRGRLRRFLNVKKTFDRKQIDQLFDEVTYRLSILHQADDVTRDMGLQVDNIFNFCIESWKPTYLQRQLLRLLHERRILDEPHSAGWPYPRPWHFLSLALVESGLEWDQIEEKVALSASIFKAKRSRQVSFTPYGQRVIVDHEVISHRKAFMQAMRKLGHRVKEGFSH